MSCLVEKSTAQSAVPVPELSEMNALRAVERVEVVPKILHFKGMLCHAVLQLWLVIRAMYDSHPLIHCSRRFFN